MIALGIPVTPRRWTLSETFALWEIQRAHGSRRRFQKIKQSYENLTLSHKVLYLTEKTDKQIEAKLRHLDRKKNIYNLCAGAKKVT
jgi:hypothetical protein